MADLLAHANPTWVSKIAIDADEDEITVTLNVPVADAGGTVASYEEVVALDDPTTPGFLHDRARDLVVALVAHVASRVGTAGGPARCASCTAPCCARVFTDVHVTQADADRLGPRLARRGVALYAQPSMVGYVGLLRRVLWHGTGKVRYEGDARPMACVFQDPKTALCTVYDRRPAVCREFTAHDCDDHEAAPARLVQLRRKALGLEGGWR